MERALKSEFDIVVVGAGPFGCFVSLLLAQNGVRVALCDQASRPGHSFAHSLQVFWPSFNDPPTRAEVAHGHEMALYLNDFCRRGNAIFTSAIEPYLAATGFLGTQSAQAMRFGTQEFEVIELNKAVSLGLGLAATANPHAFAESAPALYFANGQDFRKSIVAALTELGVNFISDTITSINESSHNCTLTAASGNELSCEQVVLATAARVGELLPHYKSILLPMTDILVSYSQAKNSDAVADAGATDNASDKTSEVLAHKDLVARLAEKPLVFRASSGHSSGILAVDAQRQPFLKISGPRFLLPDAGVAVDLTQRPMPEKLLQKSVDYAQGSLFAHIHKQYELSPEINLLSALNLHPTHIALGVDCLPCDELPILGELGKWGKILGGGGWLGSGFGAGCFAAQIICDLVLQGASTDLHPRLTPRRLFSGD